MIDLQNLCITQGNFSFQNLSLTIPTGSYGVLMGATGCGKTSLLEAVCGLRPLSAGTVRLGDELVTDLPPACRGVGYVPQDGALFGSLSVRENLAFALTLRRWTVPAMEDRVEKLASLLDIAHLLTRSIKGLSGGERQRIALGRALAFHPRFLLLDEPLSATDEATRAGLCDLLKKVQQEMEVTALHVTHSHSEAERLADVLFQFQDGQVCPVES